MKQLNLILIIIPNLISLDLTLQSTGTNANSLSPDDVDIPSENDDVIRTKIDAYVRDVVACRSSPGLTMTVVKGGKTIISQGYGFTSSNRNVSITSSTKFAIGSLSKAFTSLLAVKALVDYNNRNSPTSNITLDTPVSHYISHFRLTDDLRSNQTTLRDLLSHRVGIPNYMEPLVMGFDPTIDQHDLFTRRMEFLPSPLSFRDRFIYNNYMYGLVGHIEEEMAMDNATWEEQVRDVIMRPLGMNNSGFVKDLTDADDVALPCYTDGHATFDLPIALFNTVYPVPAAGSIYSTADDMSRWMNLMLSEGQRANPPGLEPEVTRQGFESGSVPTLSYYKMAKPEFPVSFGVLGYGLAWMSAIYRGYRLRYHTGGIVTHSSRLWLYPDLDIGIYLSARGPDHKNKSLALESILFYASDLLLGEANWFTSSSACQDPAPFVQNSSNTSEENGSNSDALADNDIFNITGIKDRYIGNYTQPFFGQVSIYTGCGEENNQLCFHYGQFGLMTLDPISASGFRGRYYSTLSYLNPEKRHESASDVEFTFDDSEYATYLSIGKDSKDDYPIFFQRQQVSSPQSSQGNGHENATGLSLSLIISILFCHFLTVMSACYVAL